MDNLFLRKCLNSATRLDPVDLIASAPRHDRDVQFYVRNVLVHLPGLPTHELQNYLYDVRKRVPMAEQRAALNALHNA